MGLYQYIALYSAATVIRCPVKVAQWTNVDCVNRVQQNLWWIHLRHRRPLLQPVQYICWRIDRPIGKLKGYNEVTCMSEHVNAWWWMHTYSLYNAPWQLYYKPCTPEPWKGFIASLCCGCLTRHVTTTQLRFAVAYICAMHVTLSLNLQLRRYTGYRDYAHVSHVMYACRPIYSR